MRSHERKKKRIVEDEQDIVKLYEIVLRKRGYEIEIATDGKEAVERYKRFDEKPDLVIQQNAGEKWS